MRLFSASLTLAAAVTTFNMASATILPPNDLHLEDNIERFAGIDEKGFGEIVDYVIGFYQPLAAVHGAKIDAKKLWSDSTVNASAQQSGNRWVVNMYGGLARRDEVTPDGFALVVCHELGHHFGGYPFSSAWAADEGQSDYFATQSCGRTIWKDQKTQNAAFRDTVGNYEKSKCDAAWNTEEDQNLCYRISAGSHSLANLLAALNKLPTPKFDTPDTAVVRSTSHSHPKAQCRLDTYFRGALCGATFKPDLIPGKSGAKSGNTKESEQIAIANSCSLQAKQLETMRPTCWFKSLLPAE